MTTIKEKVSEIIWRELDDEAFFIMTEKFEKCADKIHLLYQKEIAKEKKEMLKKIKEMDGIDHPKVVEIREYITWINGYNEALKDVFNLFKVKVKE
jgi:hypothetical protein